MDYKVRQEEKRTVAGFHLVGSRGRMIRKSFEWLTMWVDSKNIVPKERVTARYDNPDETPAKKLRCDTVVAVPSHFTLPENSEGVILTEITGGQYAVATIRVAGDDFVKPWYQFPNSLLQDSAYEMSPKPCLEVYLNSGVEDGYWDTEMCVAVQPKHHQFTSGRCVNAMTTLFFESEESKMHLSTFSFLPGNCTIPDLSVGQFRGAPSGRQMNYECF